MSEMINPRIDLAFKKIFGVEENKDILMSLINSIVSEKDRVDHIELLNPYNERNFPKDKLSILDIKARNKITQTYYLIEMQLADESDYHKRGLYSWARVYSNQIGSGGFYSNLQKTIAIHILNFSFIDYKQEKGWKEEYLSKYHHCFNLQDKVTNIEIFTDLEIHTIELSKFEDYKVTNLDKILSKVKSMLDVWVATLTHYDLLDIKNLPEKLDIPEIKKALQVMREMKFNKEERELYNQHLDFLRMEASAFQKKFLDGEAKGRAEGLAEGKSQIARNLLIKGLDIKLISDATGLTEDEIKKL